MPLSEHRDQEYAQPPADANLVEPDGTVPLPKRPMRIRRATDLPMPKTQQWIAPGYLPRGSVTGLAGDEGIGKSLFWVLLAMHITTGVPLPQLNLPKRKPADVVVIATEDGWAEVRTRLETAGADLGHIHVVCDADDGSGIPKFPEAEGIFADYMRTTKVKPALIVADAWLDTIPGGVNLRDGLQTREAVEPWKRIAADFDAAVLLVLHTNRLDSASIRDLIGQTGTLRQVVRLLLFAARHPDDGRDGGAQHLWVGPDKANTTRPAPAVQFELSVEQVRPVTDSDPGTAATLVAPVREEQTIGHLYADWKREERDAIRQATRKPTTAEKAAAWVLEYLGDRDEVPVAALKAAGEAAGHGQRALSTGMGLIGTSGNDGPGTPWWFRRQSRQPGPGSQETAKSAKTADTDPSLFSSAQSSQTWQS